MLWIRNSLVHTFRVCWSKAKLGTATIIFLAFILFVIQKAAKLFPVPQGIMILPRSFFLKWFRLFWIALTWWGLGLKGFGLIIFPLDFATKCFQPSWLLSSRANQLSKVSKPTLLSSLIFFGGLSTVVQTIPWDMFLQ